MVMNGAAEVSAEERAKVSAIYFWGSLDRWHRWVSAGLISPVSPR